MPQWSPPRYASGDMHILRLGETPREIHKQESNKEIIDINDVLSRDLPVAFYVARFRENC